MCLCSHRLALDKNGDVKSRNVAATFDLFEAEDHRNKGVENDYDSVCCAVRLAGGRSAVRVDFCNARVQEMVKQMRRCGAAVNIRISKSKFVAGCQCLKRLYFQVHEPELAAEPDAASEAIMEQGREVGLLARQMFPGGVEVGGAGGLDQAIRNDPRAGREP